MRNLFNLFTVILLFSCNKSEQPQEQVNNDSSEEYSITDIQDILVSGFFGLDNALPSILCTQPGGQLDGMPVNFKYPLDAATLSGSDFEVVDSLGNIHIPICARLAPANENGENRTVLL